MYKRRQSPALTPRPPANRIPTYEEWHAIVFDEATLFTVVTGRRPDARVRREFTDLAEAVAVACATPLSVTYAVAPSGRSIVLEHADLSDWLNRWHRNHASKGEINVTNPVINEPAQAPSSENARGALLIHWNGRGPGTATVERFPTRRAADDYAFEVLPGDRTAVVVETVLDLGRPLWNMGSLTALYNGVIARDNRRVSKFESLARGQERVYDGLIARFGHHPFRVTEVARSVETRVPTGNEPSGKKKTMSATSTEPVTTVKSTKPATDPTRKRITHGQSIRVVKPNTKRPGTKAYRNYEIMERSSTVADYLEAGGDQSTLWWNARQGNAILT